jgi:hypothetical protein
MAAMHERFEIHGAQYTEIHFKVTPFFKDLIIRRFRDGVEISQSAYEQAKAEYKKLSMASHGA